MRIISPSVSPESDLARGPVQPSPLRQRSRGLPPAFQEAAVNRVSWLALAATVALPALHLLHWLTQPAVARVTLDETSRLILLGTVLLALGVFVLRRFRVAPGSTVLRLGLGLEVVVAFALSFTETASRAITPTAPVVGISAVSPWILLTGAFIPNRPSWTLVAAVLAASTWPVAYGINTVRFGVELTPWGPLAIWIVVNYVSAGAAYVIARSTYGAALRTPLTEDIGGYHLVSPIGEGGMGEVWKATHKMLVRAAAIKIVRPDITTGVNREADAAASRFRREANLIARLQSPHTVYLYDFGVSDDGRFYYVMELLDGVSLQTLVTTFGPLSASRTIAILTQMCASLHEAHEQDLVHRDLKPSNVMLCQVALDYDFVKVLDFGLAKSVSDVGATQLTIAGMTTGTPGYIAPEVALGETSIDRRADVYALGCVAYFLLTGSLVFEEHDPTRMALMHVQQVPEPPSRRTERTIPPDLEAIVLQCLAKRPSDRPPSAAELAERLARCRVDSWSNEEAGRWWREHLPPDSPLRAQRL